MYQSESINELAQALAKAQGEMSAATKDCSNPFFNSKYADLNSVWNACREPLSKNGLSIIQTTEPIEGGHNLNTILVHSSGQWIKSSLNMVLDLSPQINKFGKEVKPNPLHLMGSYLTYYRRYALAAIVGVAPDEDEDGNLASNSKHFKQEALLEKLITSEQAIELRSVIGKCSAGYKKHISDFLQKSNLKDLSQLPQSQFHVLLNQAMEQSKTNQMQTEKEQEGVA